MSGSAQTGSRLTRWSGSFTDLSVADQRAVAELVKAGGAIQGSVEDILPRLRRTRMVALLREGERREVLHPGEPPDRAVVDLEEETALVPAQTAPEAQGCDRPGHGAVRWLFGAAPAEKTIMALICR
ncbi:MAG: hypothetical protein QM690_18015 [Sphingobium sp.]